MMSRSDMRGGDVLGVSFGTFCSSALWGGNKKKKKRWGQCTEEQKKKQNGGKQWHQPSTLTLPPTPINEPISAALQGSQSETDESTFFLSPPQPLAQALPKRPDSLSRCVRGRSWRGTVQKQPSVFFASQSAGMPVKILMWPADSVYLELPQRARCQRASAHARPPLYISWPTRLRKSETSGSKNCRRVGDGTSAAGFPSRLR